MAACSSGVSSSAKACRPRNTAWVATTSTSAPVTGGSAIAREVEIGETNSTKEAIAT
jgi:hypothetical protein